MVLCDICNVDVKNLNQHKISDKHTKKAGLEKEKKGQNIYDKDYQSLFNEYRKEKGKNKVICNICNKMYTYQNLSHHKKTIKHLDKVRGDKIDPYNFEELKLIIE